MPMKPFLLLGFFLLLSLLANVSTETAVNFDVTPAASTGFNVSAATVSKTLLFDVTKDSYLRFMRHDLYKEVLKTTTAQVERLPQLGTQKLSKEPDTWIHVPLNGGATLAIRSDNLYLSGFKARDCWGWPR